MKFQNPYPGIRPFKVDENNFFFGRDHQIAELIAKLDNLAFVSVVGTSGCGKSSLVKAGLISRLRNDNWLVLDFRPQRPLGNLGDDLKKLPFEFGEEEQRAEFRQVWLDLIFDNLQDSSAGIVETYRQSGTTQKLLVIIDQFEELFAFAARGTAEKEEAIRFANLILFAARQREFPIGVLITLRSDQLGRCSEFKGLPEMINDGLFLVPRLSRDQYREAITRPLANQGISIASNLVSQLLNDIEDDPDQLPILQHSLMVTFDFWNQQEEKGTIDISHYQHAGGMARSIDSHCEKIFKELKEKNLTLPTEIIFQRLTSFNPEGVETRTPATFQDILSLTNNSEEDIRTILDSFRNERCNFLMPPVDVQLNANSIIDLAHECIMRNWISLHRWMVKEEENKRLLHRLLEHFANYVQGERGPLKNPTLAAYKSWERYQHRDKPQVVRWAGRYTGQFKEATEFVKASIRWDNQRRQIRMLLLLATPVIGITMSLYVAEELHKGKLKEQDELFSKMQLVKQRQLDSLDRLIAINELTRKQAMIDKLEHKNDSMQSGTESMVKLIDELRKSNSAAVRSLSDSIRSITRSLTSSSAVIKDLRNRLTATRQTVNNDSSRMDRIVRDLYFEELRKNHELIAQFESSLANAQKSGKIDDRSVKLVTTYLSEIKKVVTTAAPATDNVVSKVESSYTGKEIEVYTYTRNGGSHFTQLEHYLKERGYACKFRHRPLNNQKFFENKGVLISNVDPELTKQLMQSLNGYNGLKLKEIKKWHDQAPANGKPFIVLDFE